MRLISAQTGQKERMNISVLYVKKIPLLNHFATGNSEYFGLEFLSRSHLMHFFHGASPTGFLLTGQGYGR